MKRKICINIISRNTQVADTDAYRYQERYKSLPEHFGCLRVRNIEKRDAVHRDYLITNLKKKEEQMLHL